MRQAMAEEDAALFNDLDIFVPLAREAFALLEEAAEGEEGEGGRREEIPADKGERRERRRERLKVGAVASRRGEDGLNQLVVEGLRGTSYRYKLQAYTSQVAAYQSTRLHITRWLLLTGDTITR